MYKGSSGTGDSLVKMMFQEANLCQYRIDETEKAIESRERLKHDIAINRENQKLIEDVTKYLKEVRKKTVEYNAEKKKKSLASIYSAIYSAKSILPDTTSVNLKVEREDALLINDSGDDVNKVEGSAFRAMLSFFIRSVILKNTTYLPFMIYDEPLTTLSVETSAQLSPYLPLIAQDAQLILIEQKQEIFEQVDAEMVYHFKKSEGRTVVRREA